MFASNYIEARTGRMLVSEILCFLTLLRGSNVARYRRSNGKDFGLPNGGSWPTVLSGVRAALRPLKNSWFRRTSASWHRAILTLSAKSGSSSSTVSCRPKGCSNRKAAGRETEVHRPEPNLVLRCLPGGSHATSMPMIRLRTTLGWRVI